MSLPDNLDARRLQIALDLARIGFWERDLRTNKTVRSPIIDEIFGFEPGEVGDDAAPFLARVHPDDRWVIEARMREGIAKDAPYFKEFRIRHTDGTWRWIAARGEVFKDADGRPERVVSILQDITERKRAEEDLRASQAKLQIAIDATDLGLWHHDLVTGALDWSERLKALYGLSADAPVSFDTFVASLHPADRTRVLAQYQAARHSRDGRFRFEHRIVTASGEVRWVQSSGQLIFERERRAVRAIGSVLDITARMQLETELRARTVGLEELTDALGAACAIIRDLDGTIRFWSRGVEALYGWTAAEAVGKDAHQLLETRFPKDRAEIEAALLRDGAWQGELQGVARDGRMISVIGHWTLRRDGTGRPTAVVEVHNDITALRTVETRLALSQEAAGIGIWDWDIVRNTETWSPTLFRLYGTAPTTDPVPHKRWIDFIHADDRVDVAECLVRALEGAPYDKEFRIVRPDGEVRWIAMRGRIERAEDGRPLRMIGLNFDVTERKRAEEAVRSSERRLKLALDAARLGTYERDLSTNTGQFSPRGSELHGLPPGQEVYTEKSWLQTIHPDDRPIVEERLAHALAGLGPYDIEYRAVWPDGQVRWLAARGEVCFDADGTPLRVAGVVQDISAQKQTEDRLKLLAAEVDHRAKNLLAIVQVMLRQTRAATVKEYAAQAQGRVTALARAHALLSQARWEGADLHRLVEEELAAFRDGMQRVRVEGPVVMLPPRAAQSFALALHELGTNAVKYGALSVPRGRVDLAWSVHESALRVIWRERDGPAVMASSRRGFGTNVIEQSIRQQLDGDVAFDWRPEGLQCTLTVPATYFRRGAVDSRNEA